jgi:hypothetical protein
MLGASHATPLTLTARAVPILKLARAPAPGAAVLAVANAYVLSSRTYHYRVKPDRAYARHPVDVGPARNVR